MARKVAPVQPLLIPAAKVPEIYGVAYNSVRDLVFRGELHVVKVGRAWYLRRADLDARFTPQPAV